MKHVARLVVLGALYLVTFNAGQAGDGTHAEQIAAIGAPGTVGQDRAAAWRSWMHDLSASYPVSPVALDSSFRDPHIAARNRLVRLFPLHWAAIQDQSDVIGLLVETGGEIDNRDDRGRTPLMLAAAFGNLAAIDALLSHGADPNARDWANGDLAQHFAARSGSVDAMRLLVGRGASADARSSLDGRSAIHYAAAFGHARMIRFLIATGVDPNVQDREGISPIFYASRRNQYATVALLESLGGRYGGMHEAVNADDVGRAWSLINAGADVDEPGFAGHPIHLAASRGFLGLVGILADNGADLESDAGSNGSTPMHMAAMTDHPAIIEFLASRGADLELLDSEGRTPLFVAANFGSAHAVEKLIGLGADIRAIDGFYGRSPLHVAALSGHTDIIKLLVASGVDINEVSPASGWSALHFAFCKNQVEAARFLIEHGADINLRDHSGKTPDTVHGTRLAMARVLRQIPAQ